MNYNRTLANLDYPALARQVIEDGGFTTALDGTQPHEGFAVAVQPDAERLWFAQLRGMLLERALANFIYAYVIEHGRALRNGFYLGAWMTDDGRRVVLDLVQVIPSRTTAIAVATATRQDAIYDLARGVEIDVDGEIERMLDKDHSYPEEN